MVDGINGMIASFGMYDLPWIASANDELWSAIARFLNAAGVRDVPMTLDRTTPIHDVWTDPALLLGQTCGYPLVTSLAGRVQVVATPHYTTLGCVGASYRSWIIVSADGRAETLADLRGARAAINGHDSNSGMNLFRAEIAAVSKGPRFFATVTVTGSHLATAEMIAGGGADVGAIDCVTWAHIARARPGLIGRVRIIAATSPSPGLPLITSLKTPAATVATLRRALDWVASEPTLDAVRRTLFLDRFETLPDTAYDVVGAYEEAARILSYPALA